MLFVLAWTSPKSIVWDVNAIINWEIGKEIVKYENAVKKCILFYLSVQPARQS